MKVIPDKLLRDSLKINRDVPVYYLSMETIEKSLMEKGVMDKDEHEKYMSNFCDYRPFDEVVVIVSKLDRYEIVHFLKDGKYRNFSHTEGMAISNRTIREGFEDKLMSGKLDIEKDKKSFNENKSNAMAIMLPFSIKKNVLMMCEGKTYKQGKKGKVKKQKYLYVSSCYFEQGASEINGSKVISSYPITKVAGHPRFFRKKPETKGHDRNGNEVTGWTWVSPYTRGEGEEIENKIRKFLR